MTDLEIVNKLIPPSPRAVRIGLILTFLRKNPDGVDYDEILAELIRRKCKIGHRTVVRDLEDMRKHKVAVSHTSDDDGRRIIWTLR